MAQFPPGIIYLMRKVLIRLVRRLVCHFDNGPVLQKIMRDIRMEARGYILWIKIEVRLILMINWNLKEFYFKESKDA